MSYPFYSLDKIFNTCKLSWTFLRTTFIIQRLSAILCSSCDDNKLSAKEIKWESDPSSKILVHMWDPVHFKFAFLFCIQCALLPFTNLGSAGCVEYEALLFQWVVVWYVYQSICKSIEESYSYNERKTVKFGRRRELIDYTQKVKIVISWTT